jgi:3',5'-cyclic AMP phosphodiesterase CpdA
MSTPQLSQPLPDQHNQPQREIRPPVPQSSFTEGLQKQKVPGRTTIAHISDLHFDSTTNFEKEDVWKVLPTDLRPRQIDLLAVTGDLIDSSVADNLRKDGVRMAFVNVKRFLLALCGELGIDPNTALSIVPGNHDYRIKGVVSPDSKFRLLRKMKQSLITAHDDLFLEQFAQYYQPKVLLGLRCCLFTFDSNTTDWNLNLASGRITNYDLASFSDLCQELPKRYPAEWLTFTRIALLHHHPMPIAATELRGGFIESETYHLLKNAGLFMTEMVNKGVELVLHGHKHYPALSRATFPISDLQSHTISVIAAGSASVKGLPHTSYNLITIADNGSISVERRVREHASYGRGVLLPSLQPYEQTRLARFRRLAAVKQVTLKVGKWTRVDIIQPGSGDDDIIESYDDVRSFSAEARVDKIPVRYSSSSGFVSEPHLTSADRDVGWEEDTSVRGKGAITFDPPIGDEPISFDSQVTIHNAFHFNEQDRLAVTGTDPEEAAYVTITDACELLTFKVKFPSGFQALWPKIHVLDLEEHRDGAEERYSASRFTRFLDDNTAVLIVDYPLPGYTYKIIWGLPKTEDDELRLKPADRLLVKQIKTSLLQLRTDSSSQRTLETLKKMVNNVSIGSLKIGASDLEIALHVHDPTVGKLVCVAALSNESAVSRLTSKDIPVGATTIGQAYRRRESIRWISGNQAGQYYRSFLDYDEESPHTGIVSIPLFFPINDGGKTGVLTLATRGYAEPMLPLLQGDLSPEIEAGFQLLLSTALMWYANELMVAVGLPTMAGP